MAENLTRDDFVLLMGSYRTQVELNTKLLNEQHHILSKMNIILDMQKKTCETIDKQTESYNTGMNKFIDILIKHDIDAVREYGKIKNRIYVSLIGMSTIIIALLTLII